MDNSNEQNPIMDQSNPTISPEINEASDSKSDSKQKNKKTVVIISFAVGLAFVVVIALLFGFLKNNESMELLQYLEKKYGKDEGFTLLDYTSFMNAGAYLQIGNFTSDKINGETFNTTSSNHNTKDNYIETLQLSRYGTKLKKYFSDTFKDAFDGNYEPVINIEVDAKDADTSELSLDEIIRRDSYSFSVKFTIDHSLYEKNSLDADELKIKVDNILRQNNLDNIHYLALVVHYDEPHLCPPGIDSISVETSRASKTSEDYECVLSFPTLSNLWYNKHK